MGPPIHWEFIVCCLNAAVVQREAAIQLERIEEAKASLIQTADALMRSPDHLVEGREALTRLRSQAVKALGALEILEELRGLTDEERTYLRTFEELLAVARRAG